MIKIWHTKIYITHIRIYYIFLKSTLSNLEEIFKNLKYFRNKMFDQPLINYITSFHFWKMCLLFSFFRITMLNSFGDSN